MTDCLFCKMVAGEIKPDVIYETDDVLAFRDIRPQAKVHALVIPKRHIRSMILHWPENCSAPSRRSPVGRAWRAAVTAQSSTVAVMAGRRSTTCTSMFWAAGS